MKKNGMNFMNRKINENYVKFGKDKVKFSPREQEIYDIMQKEPDKSPAEIAEATGLITQSVYAYQSSIRKKLQLMKGKENGTIASDDTD